MPALAELTRRRQRVVFVAPPYIPYAPALDAHGLDLRYVVQIEPLQPKAHGAPSSVCVRVRAAPCSSWLHKPTTHNCVACNWRPKAAMRSLSCSVRHVRASKASPAALRLQLHADAAQVDIEILKCRGNLDWQFDHDCDGALELTCSARRIRLSR